MKPSLDWPLPFIAISVALAALTGCRLVEKTVTAPVKAVSAVVPDGKSAPLDPAALQTELQRYADEFLSRTGAALDDYVALAGTADARHQALKWKVALGSAAVSIASGPNPQANLLDLLALATITHTAVNEAGQRAGDSAALQRWQATSRTLETNAWRLAEKFLKPGEVQEVRDAVQRWWETNPGVGTGFLARPDEFTSLIRKTGETSERPGSVFSLVGLDPTAGLDPAVREVTRTRLFAERAIFLAQRMPFLVRWQAELLTVELLHQEHMANALGAVDRLSRAAESASLTASQLPDRITAERKAVLEALETQEGRLRELSAEVGRTLAAGENMSTSLNTTLLTFDALMKRFGVGEPRTTPRNTNAPPFSIQDYADAAAEIAAMAQQLDVLLKDAGTTLDSPALDRLAGQTRSDVQSVLTHAFLLAASLVVLILASAMLYRHTGKSRQRNP